MKFAMIAIYCLLSLSTAFASEVFDVPVKSEVFDRGYGLEVTINRLEGVVVPPGETKIIMTKPNAMRAGGWGSGCEITLRSSSTQSRIIRSGRKFLLNKLDGGLHRRDRNHGNLVELYALKMESTDDKGIASVLINGVEMNRNLPLLDLRELKRVCDLDFKVVSLDWDASEEI